MNMRNDSLLYSGVSSKSYATRVKSTRDKASEEKQEKRNVLTPELTVLQDFIKAEREEELKRLANLPLTLETTEDSVKAELRAHQKNLLFIQGFETRLANALRRANA